MSNAYRKLWKDYISEIEELKGSYNHFSDKESIRTAKLAIGYLNYLFGLDTFSVNRLPFDIDYSKTKSLWTLNLIIFYSQRIEDYKEIIDECKAYMEEFDIVAYEGLIMESINIPSFSTIVNELGKQKDFFAIMDLSHNEYTAVVGGLTEDEQSAIARIENAKEYKFETIYYDLNEGDDEGLGSFFCCYLMEHPKQCENVRFFCSQYKIDFICIMKNAEKFFY